MTYRDRKRVSGGKKERERERKAYGGKEKKSGAH